MSWNDFWWAWSQTLVLFLLSKSHRGLVISARSGENLLNWLHMPRNCLRSLTDLGSSMSVWYCLYLLWVWLYAFLVNDIWLRKFTELAENTHFSLLRVTWNFCNCSSTAIMSSLCSCWFDSWMRMASIRHVTPVRPSRAVDIHCWNDSGADEIPEGNWLKQNLPKGIINIVNNADCLDSSVCQNPELAANLLNTLASLNWARVWSTEC